MRGKAGPKPEEVETKPPTDETPEPKPNGNAALYACHDCAFKTESYEESGEHASAMNHSIVVAAIQDKQPELFSEPNPVRRLSAKFTDAEIHELETQTANLCRRMIDEEQKAQIAKEAAKAFRELVEENVAKLNHPYETRDVECEWEIVIEANAKTLRRLDTGEVIETRGLSAEDRQKELDRVAASN